MSGRLGGGITRSTIRKRVFFGNSLFPCSFDLTLISFAASCFIDSSSPVELFTEPIGWILVEL